MTVGKRITARMKELGINQTQLARRVGVTRTAVSGWLKDVNPPKRKHVPRLAAVLGVDPRALSPLFDGGDVGQAAPVLPADPAAGLRMAIEIVKGATLVTALDPDEETVRNLKVVIITLLDARLKELA
jgi:transcriptional regulator with XRE-family HTH domain